MNIKNKVLAGILSGAIIFGGGIALNPVQAEPAATEQQEDWQQGPRHERREMSPEKLSEFAKKIADTYSVNQVEVEEALKNRVHFEDIKVAAMLAKLSGKSFSEVLEMKSDWWQVAEKLGVTREQMEAQMEAERLDDLVKRSKLDQKTVESLLKDKYDPYDITIAGIIASSSGKNVKTVLSKRKLNNTWEDVAKEFKVDLQKEMRPHKDKKK